MEVWNCGGIVPSLSKEEKEEEEEEEEEKDLVLIYCLIQPTVPHGRRAECGDSRMCDKNGCRRGSSKDRRCPIEEGTAGPPQLELYRIRLMYPIRLGHFGKARGTEFFRGST